MDIFALASGIYLVLFAFLIRVENIKSSIVFCAIPGVIGVFNVIVGLKMLGQI